MNCWKICDKLYPHFGREDGRAGLTREMNPCIENVTYLLNNFHFAILSAYNRESINLNDKWKSLGPDN